MAKIERLQLRIKSQERQEIEAIAEEMGYANISDYARDFLLRKKSHKRIDPKEIDYIILRLTEIRKLL